MTDRAAAALFALLLTCFTVWLCFRCIAWVARHGWRSMLGPVALRGRAVVEWQDCDRKDGDDWDEVEVIAQLVMAPDADEETEVEVEHFDLWRAELTKRYRVRRYLRRMDRWSR